MCKESDLDKGTSLFETLATISAEQASTPISTRCASIAAQVRHVDFYLEVLERYMMQQEVGKVDWGHIWQTVKKFRRKNGKTYRRTCMRVTTTFWKFCLLSRIGNQKIRWAQPSPWLCILPTTSERSGRLYACCRSKFLTRNAILRAPPLTGGIPYGYFTLRVLFCRRLCNTADNISAASKKDNSFLFCKVGLKFPKLWVK